MSFDLSPSLSFHGISSSIPLLNTLSYWNEISTWCYLSTYTYHTNRKNVGRVQFLTSWQRLGSSNSWISFTSTLPPKTKKTSVKRWKIVFIILNQYLNCQVSSFKVAEFDKTSYLDFKMQNRNAFHFEKLLLNTSLLTISWTRHVSLFH